MSRSGLNLRGGSVDSLRSVMSGLLDGRCLCGRLTYRCDGEPLVTVVCHCKDCQRQTGSAFSIFVVVPRPTLHVAGDTLATYVTVGADSGEERQRQSARSAVRPSSRCWPSSRSSRSSRRERSTTPRGCRPPLRFGAARLSRGLRRSRTAGGSPAACRPDWTASIKHCAPGKRKRARHWQLKQPRAGSCFACRTSFLQSTLSDLQCADTGALR